MMNFRKAGILAGLALGVSVTPTTLNGPAVVMRSTNG